MANRNWSNGGKVFSMNASPVMIPLTIQIGAAGAVSSVSGAAVQSVTHVSTGLYKIKMQSQTNFPALLAAIGSMQQASAALSGIMAIEIQHDPQTSAQVADGAELSFKCLDKTGAVADPASGSAINILTIFNNSSVM